MIEHTIPQVLLQVFRVLPDNGAMVVIEPWS